MKKTLFAVAALAALVLTGCAKKSNVVKMGTNAAFAPFEYHEGDKIVGFDISMSQLVARDYGKELQVVDQNFDGLIAALQSGSVDFVAAGMTATEERRKNVDFSEPYFSSKQVIIVNADNNDVTSVADLEGQKVGCQAGTTGEGYVTDSIPDAQCMSYKTGVDAGLALKNKAIYAVILDELPAKEIVKQNPELKVVDDDFCTDVYAIAVKKGNKELLDSINKTISNMKANGTYEKLINCFMPVDGNIVVPDVNDLK